MCTSCLLPVVDLNVCCVSQQIGAATVLNQQTATLDKSTMNFFLCAQTVCTGQSLDSFAVGNGIASRHSDSSIPRLSTHARIHSMCGGFVEKMRGDENIRLPGELLKTLR
jgi:hypothetical protein